MFSSKRKSRPPGPQLPPTDPGNASKNALAAATAIGQALKTGAPIPRSNSLQRSSSLQRNSFRSVPRSSSLMGLQGPPRQFQEPQGNTLPQSQTTRHAPVRSQSLSTASQRNKAMIQRAHNSTNQPPRMVKKHIPGPYGLITIEVPAEEPVKKVAPRRSQTFSRPPSSSAGSVRSSASSITSGKRAAFVDDLPEVNEDEPLEFEQTPVSVQKQNNLKFIQEDSDEDRTPPVVSSSEDVAEKVPGVSDELEKLKLEKDAEETKIMDSMEDTQKEEQKTLTKKSSVEKPQIIVENGDKHVSDYENDVLDQYTDLPSTAKSSDTLGAAGQSSVTTTESDSLGYGSSMAQQLRPTIPALNVNNKETANGLSPSISTNSSVYSDETREQTSVEVPTRSEKRPNASPRKSALKHKSSSTANLALDDNNPASQAYLSLATAENTRLNAMNHSSTSLSRTTSNRAVVVDKPLSGRPQPQFAQNNRPRGPPPQNGRARPMSTMDSPSKPLAHQNVQRPRSSQGFRSQQQQPQERFRPGSAQGFRGQQQRRPMPQQPRPVSQQPRPTSQIPRSASNAAALNATMKKEEIAPPQLQKKSSFEKERPQDQHAAFKRKSLRDPSFGGHHATVESNLGFYRHQAQQQKAQHQAPPPQQTSNFSSALEGFSNFKSRFSDSDSDIDVPVGNGNAHSFAPPPNNPVLRKPKSSYTLRSSSVTGIPPNPSPAKSLPEKRATRYFSESDKEKLFNEHLEKTKAAVHEDKKKSKFGKLKKLFGRSSKD